MLNILRPILLLQISIWLGISVTASEQSDPTRISSYGLALPKENVTLRPNVDSHVKKIVVREGQHVKKGDLLIELNWEMALAKRNVAKLAAAESGARMGAEAELKFAKSNYKTLEGLYRKKAVNQKELEEAKLRLDGAQANYQTMLEAATANQARLQLADAEYNEYFIRAPFDGEVVKLAVGVGSVVTSSTDVLQIVSLDSLIVELYMPIDEAVELRSGDQRELRLHRPFSGRTLNAQVIFRSPMIESTSRCRSCCI